jgi:hypothetical protein
MYEVFLSVKTPLCLLAGMALVALGNLAVGAMTVTVAVLLASVGLPAIRYPCKRYPLAQVRALLSDPTRAALGRQAFACIHTADQTTKQAA